MVNGRTPLFSYLAIYTVLGFVGCAKGNPKDAFGEERWTIDRKEKWGYVHVRPNTHMFYWFYYTSHMNNYQNRPWILWLQGGPGGSSCGNGNFEIIGPLRVDLKPRNTTWVREASVLFVDNPVGSGYSYVDDEDAYTTDMDQITADLMEVLRVFLQRTPAFKTRPLYIFGQSYGGKMAAYFSRHLYNMINSGSIEAMLLGFAMGNAWISPLDSVLNCAAFLHFMSLVDNNGKDRIEAEAQTVKDAIYAGNWTQASENWRTTQDVILTEADGVSFHQIFNFYQLRYESAYMNALNILMNGTIRTKLGIIPANVTWGESFRTVFYKLSNEYMRPAISVVSDVLENTNLKVIVYQGQLDLICNTKGAMDWVEKLQWSNMTFFREAQRRPFRNLDASQTQFFVKAYDKLKFYWILRAGHSTPSEEGEATHRVLNRILDDLD